QLEFAGRLGRTRREADRRCARLFISTRRLARIVNCCIAPFRCCLQTWKTDAGAVIVTANTATSWHRPADVAAAFAVQELLPGVRHARQRTRRRAVAIAGLLARSLPALGSGDVARVVAALIPLLCYATFVRQVGIIAAAARSGSGLRRMFCRMEPAPSFPAPNSARAAQRPRIQKTSGKFFSRPWPAADARARGICRFNVPGGVRRRRLCASAARRARSRAFRRLFRQFLQPDGPVAQIHGGAHLADVWRRSHSADRPRVVGPAHGEREGGVRDLGYKRRCVFALAGAGFATAHVQNVPPHTLERESDHFVDIDVFSPRRVAFWIQYGKLLIYSHHRRAIPSSKVRTFSLAESNVLDILQFALTSIGEIACRLLGTEQFLATYLSAGICSSLFSHVFRARFNVDPHVGGLGASGALYSCFALIAMKYPDAQGSIIFLPFIPFSLGMMLPAMVTADALGVYCGDGGFLTIMYVVAKV
ncbi:MAG: hypothetical protein BJ554DRAFT_4377, partial [Olpidium bornovanus]